MNRRLLRAYYIISVLFLLALLGFAVWRVRLELDRSAAWAERALSGLQMKALSTYLAEGSFESEYFKYEMKSQLAREPRLLALVVYSGPQGIQYLAARNRSLLAGAPEDLASWKGKPEYALRPIIERSFTVPFTDRYFLDAVFRLLDWPDLHPALRELFYLVLAYLAVAAVMLLAAGTSAWSGGPARTVPAAGGALAPFPPEESAAGAAAGPVSTPAGLPANGPLASQLERELERAAASGRELSLLLACLEGEASRAARAYNLRQLHLQARSSLSCRDLAFEYDARTCAFILPGMDLKQAIQEAGALQKKLAQADWAGGRGVGVCMGLTSRNGRPVGAARFLQEAAVSLQRARKEGPGRIVAFQADPQKYREALTGTGKTRP